MTDNIFALSTILGKSGVAVIRVSGKGALNAALKLNVKKELKPNQVYVTEIYSHSKSIELIDKCLIIYFKAPYSFTGEDIIEFHTHGSIAVVKELLEELSKIEGFRLAEPGEFSKRAFLNNKLDLTQAEGLVELIEAETSVQKQIALRQINGDLKNLYETWRSDIITILAHLEAYIDFPEDDLPPHALNEINNKIHMLISNIEKHINDGNKGEILMRGIRVAIIGEPNVGKSSLFNKLAKREVAIVSQIAGTTRDVLEVKLDLDGYPFILYDTAGLRETTDIIEQEGVKRAVLTQQNADICILIADNNNYKQTLADLSGKHQVTDNQLLVINKIDLIKKDVLSNEIINFKEGIIKISVQENKGIDELINKLINFAQQKFHILESEPLITRTRYRSQLEICLTYLKKFSIIQKNLELSAEDVRVAASSLGMITGKIDVEEILDNIFATFCIGK